jgi:4-oxalocrotonate tautomerase
MPVVILKIQEGKTIEQKRALVRDLTEAVEKNLKTGTEAITVEIFEFKKENLGKGGKLVADR